MANTVSTLTLKINASNATKALNNLHKASTNSLRDIGSVAFTTGKTIDVSTKQLKSAINEIMKSGSGFEGLLNAAKVTQKSMDKVSARMFQKLVEEAESAASKARKEILEIQGKLRDVEKGNVDIKSLRAVYKVKPQTTNKAVTDRYVKDLRTSLQEIELGTFEEISNIMTRGETNAKRMQKAVQELAGADGFLKLSDAIKLAKISDVEFIETLQDAETQLKQYGQEIFVSAGATEKIASKLNEYRNVLSVLKKEEKEVAREIKVVKEELRQADQAGNSEKVRALAKEYNDLSTLMKTLSNVAGGLSNTLKNGDVTNKVLSDSFQQVANRISNNIQLIDKQLEPSITSANKDLVSMAIAADHVGISTHKLGKAIEFAISDGKDFESRLGKIVLTTTQAEEAWASYNYHLRQSAKAGVDKVMESIGDRLEEAKTSAELNAITLGIMDDKYKNIDITSAGLIGRLQELGRTMVVLNTGVREQIGLSGENASSFNSINGIITAVTNNLENLYSKSRNGTLDQTAILQNMEQLNRINSMLDLMVEKFSASGNVSKELADSINMLKSVLNSAGQDLDMLNIRERERLIAVRDTASAYTNELAKSIDVSTRALDVGRWERFTSSLADGMTLLKSGSNIWYLFRRAMANSQETTKGLAATFDNMSKTFSYLGKSIGPVTDRMVKQSAHMSDVARKAQMMATEYEKSILASNEFKTTNRELISNLKSLEETMDSVRKMTLLGKNPANKLTDAFYKIDMAVLEAEDRLKLYSDTMTEVEKDGINRLIASLKVYRNDLELTTRFNKAAQKEQGKYGTVSSKASRAMKDMEYTVKAVGKVVKTTSKPVTVLTKNTLALGTATQRTVGDLNIFRNMLGANVLGSIITDIRYSVQRLIRTFYDANMTFASFKANLTGLISGRGGFINASDRIRAINTESVAWFNWAKDVIAKSSFELVEVLETIPQMMKYGFDPTEWMYPMVEIASSFGENIDDVNEAIYRFATRAQGWKKSLLAIGIPIQSVTAYMQTQADGTKKAAEYLDVYDEETGNVKRGLDKLGIAEYAMFNANGELNLSLKESVELLRAWSLQSSMVRGQAVEQAKTFKGAVSNFKDAIGLLFVALGTPIFEKLGSIITEINDKIITYREYLDAIASGIGNAIARISQMTFDWLKNTKSALAVFLAFWETIHAVLRKDGEDTVRYLSVLVDSFVRFLSDIISGTAAFINKFVSGWKQESKAAGAAIGKAISDEVKKSVDVKYLMGTPSKYKKESKDVGKAIGTSIAEGVSESIGSGMGASLSKTFLEVTGESLSSVSAKYARLGSEAVGYIGGMVDFVVDNIVDAGDSAVSAAVVIKSKLLSALSVSGGETNAISIAQEYAQQFLGPLQSVAEFVSASMAAITASANLNRIKKAIEAAERARDAAIRIIDAEIDQIQAQISGIERQSKAYDKRLEEIGKIITDKVAKQLEEMGIIIDESLIERLQLQLDLYQFEYDANQDRIDALVREREALGIKVMSQEEIQLRANQGMLEDRVKQIQQQLAEEERNVKLRDLLTKQLELQYANEIETIKKQKEATEARIELLQEQLDAKNNDKVDLEKVYAEERRAEQERLDAAQLVADETATSVSILTELYKDLKKNNEENETNLIKAFSGLPDAVSKPFDMFAIQKELEGALELQKDSILESTQSTMSILANAFVDLIESLFNIVLAIFGKDLITTDKYTTPTNEAAGRYGGKYARTAPDRLGEIVDTLQDYMGVGEESAFRAIPDMIRKMDELITILHNWVLGQQQNAGIKATAKENLGVDVSDIDLLKLKVGVAFSTMIAGEQAGINFADAWAQEIAARSTHISGGFGGDIETEAKETAAAVEKTFSDSALAINSNFKKDNNPIVSAWSWLQDTLVGHSIVPDTVNSIIAEFERLNTWLNLNAVNLSTIAATYSSIFSQFTPGAYSTPISSMGSNVQGVGGIGSATFIFAPVLSVGAEVDKAVIGNILTEQRKDYEKSMTDFFKREVRR